MSWTKRQFVEQAFEAIGYASYVYDLQPEQLQSAMYRLDAMIATWNGWGIRIAYPLPASPQDADLDTQTDVPDYANEAIYLNLALRTAPTIGLPITEALKLSARAAYTELIKQSSRPTELQFPDSLPAGAGNKPWRFERPFLRRPKDRILAGEDGPIEFN